MNHTPGPWETSYGSVRTVYLVEGNYHELIANVSPGGDPTKEEANARLIAAAPDLLEALENLFGVASQIPALQPGSWEAEAIDAAHAAIAKARGEDVPVK